MGHAARMELRHLRYFIAIAEASSFTRASARLRISQPTLSRQMRDLEAHLGVALFEKRGGPVTLTAAGRHLQEGAKQWLARLDLLTASTQAAGRASSRLRIGYFGAYASELLAPSLRQFRKMEPHVSVELIDLPPGVQAEELDANRLDLCLLGHLPKEHRRHFAARPLATLSLFLALPAGHLLAKRRILGLETLREASFIGYAEREFPGRTEFFQEACRARGFEPKIVRRVDSLTSMLLAVGAGEGIGFGPPQLKQQPHVGVVFSRPAPPGLNLVFHAAWKRGTVAPLLHRLIDLLPSLS